MADTRHKPAQPAAKPEPPKAPDYSRALLELFIAHTELELFRATARNDSAAMRMLGAAVANAKAVLA
jgi:hypothetical protein